MTDTDHSQTLGDSVRTAYKKKQALRITGSGSKDFLGRRTDGEPLAVSGHRGIVEYEPTELVVTARAGTTLQELDATLREREQMLPFEPPSFSDTATLGEAMVRDDNGVVRRRLFQCIGCGSCARACPFGVLPNEPTRRQIAKCEVDAVLGDREAVFVRAGDPLDMAEKLDRLLQSHVDRQDRQSAARQRAINFDYAARAERILAIYYNLSGQAKVR